MANKYLSRRNDLVSQSDNQMIERARVPRATFINQWTRKTAFDAGYLVPFLVDEILPGDHMKYDVTAYLRMSTPLFPLLDNQRVDTFFFFVPCRILWTNWKRMMGEQANPTDTIAYTVPLTINTGGVSVGSLPDHMGLPFITGLIDPTSQWAANVLPFRAYNRIYNEWFRDENLQVSVYDVQGDGPDAITNYSLKRRGKFKDYFTSALPWPQKFLAPTVPLGGNAPITGIGFNPLPTAVGTTNAYQTGDAAGTPSLYTYAAQVSPVIAASPGLQIQTDAVGIPQVYANLAAATGVAINTFRQAFMIQQLLERDARGGTRYTEMIKSHFGVTNPDFRLQRPEYIGGGQSDLQITPIAQTAPTTGVPLGALGAAGTATGRHFASYAATEHGYILGIINVRSEISYQRQLHKMWNRRDRYDFYLPSLAQLGEQPIYNKEIWAQGTFGGTADDEVFGYQERWHELRTRQSEITGKMRSGVSGTLDAWHFAQQFTSVPVLNDAFIIDNPPMSRVLAAGTLAANQQYIADIMIHREATRPLPVYGTPATLGKF